MPAGVARAKRSARAGLRWATGCGLQRHGASLLRPEPTRIAHPARTRGATPLIARARSLVLRFGASANSYQILNPGIEHWFSEAGDAAVGYAQHSGFRVVAGAPVCAAERLGSVLGEFESDARRRGLRVCYFAVEPEFAGRHVGSPQHSLVRLGAQPYWEPSCWEETLEGHPSMRAQLRRARNKQVVVHEVVGDAAPRREMRVCLKQWLDTRGAPPMHFLVEPETLGLLEDRRTFVAERSDLHDGSRQVLAFLVASPIPSRNGWLVEQIIRGQGAVNGTTELLIDTAMRALAADGASFVTLGLSPLSSRGNVGHDGAPLWLRLLLGWLRAHGRRFYNFEGLDAFKAKLRPHGWAPIYAVIDCATVSPRALYAIAGAFTAGRPLSATLRALAWAAGRELGLLRRRVSNLRQR